MRSWQKRETRASHQVQGAHAGPAQLLRCQQPRTAPTPLSCRRVFSPTLGDLGRAWQAAGRAEICPLSSYRKEGRKGVGGRVEEKRRRDIIWTGTRREQRKLNSSSVKVMKWRETFSLVYVIAVMVVFVQ